MSTDNKLIPASVKTVIFDLDDTLLDSAGARIQALHKVFSEAGVRRRKAAEFLNNLGGSPLIQGLERLQAEQNINDDLFLAYRRAYWLREPGSISLFPGVNEMLVELSSKKIKLGIVTQKGRDFDFEGYRVGAAGELDKLGILGLFSVIIGFEDVSRPKPDPSGIFLALNATGAEAKEAVVVGDSAADMQAARSAGCFGCLASWGGVSSPNSEGISADYILKSPSELARLFQDNI
jgi:pyrophosphatase PpaX